MTTTVSSCVIAWIDKSDYCAQLLFYAEGVRIRACVGVRVRVRVRVRVVARVSWKRANQSY